MAHVNILTHPVRKKKEKPCTCFLSFSQLLHSQGEEVGGLIFLAEQTRFLQLSSRPSEGMDLCSFLGRMCLLCCRPALFCRSDPGAPRDMLIETNLCLLLGKK